jgi:hypothetical protein
MVLVTNGSGQYEHEDEAEVVDEEERDGTYMRLDELDGQGGLSDAWDGGQRWSD